MKLEKYIYSLLFENETVIIPGFGAFLSDYQPSVIDFETDSVTPPSKNISFNPKIRNNDGVLVNSVAETEGISHFQALKLIEKERDKILNRLDKGEHVKFENLGNLYFSPDHGLVFDSEVEDNLLLDSYGLGPVSLLDEKTAEKKPGADEIMDISEAVGLNTFTPGQPKEIQKEWKEAELTENSQENKPEEILPETVEGPVVTEIHENTDISDNQHIKLEEDQTEATPVLSTETKEDNTGANVFPEPPVYYSEPETAYNYEDDFPRSNRKWWLLLLLLPIALIAYLLFIQKPTHVEIEATGKTHIQPEIATNDTLKNSTVTANPDTTKVVLPPADSVAKKAETPIVSTSTSAGPFYYIIGGSFSVEENAEKYIRNLKKKGMNGIKLGKKGAYYIVAVAKFSSEKEAQAELNRMIKENPKNELWVLKK